MFVALCLVHSHGTEDRPAAKFIPKQPVEYEYIVFKGSDIKDLTVHTDDVLAAEVEVREPISDPAIVSVSEDLVTFTQLWAYYTFVLDTETSVHNLLYLPF